MSNGSLCTLQIAPNEQCKKVKTRIAKFEKTTIDRIVIYFNEKEVTNDTILFSCGRPKDIVFIVENSGKQAPTRRYQCLLDIKEQKSVTVNINPLFTIAQLKRYFIEHDLKGIVSNIEDLSIISPTNDILDDTVVLQTLESMRIGHCFEVRMKIPSPIKLPKEVASPQPKLTPRKISGRDKVSKSQVDKGSPKLLGLSSPVRPMHEHIDLSQTQGRGFLKDFKFSGNLHCDEEDHHEEEYHHAEEQNDEEYPNEDFYQINQEEEDEEIDYSKLNFNMNLKMNMPFKLPGGKKVVKRFPIQASIEEVKQSFSEDLKQDPKSIELSYLGVPITEEQNLMEISGFHGTKPISIQIKPSANSKERTYTFITPDKTQSYQLSFHLDAKVEDARDVVASVFSTSPPNVTLLFAGKTLHDHQKLKDLHIPRQGKIIVIIKDDEPILIQTPYAVQRSMVLTLVAKKFQRPFQMCFFPKCTISEVKQAVAEYLELPDSDQIEFICEGRYIENDMVLGEIETNKELIFLVNVISLNTSKLIKSRQGFGEDDDEESEWESQLYEMISYNKLKLLRKTDAHRHSDIDLILSYLRCGKDIELTKQMLADML